jgi:D-arabinose 1-dehydrogenase-like Zn-dependent alcohol dehydrogenase
MRGAVFLGNRRVELRSLPDPTPGSGEVVIEMKASGMCGSDLNFYRAAPGEAQRALGLGGNAEPFVAGHEPCGVVVARGPGVSEREAPIGQRVMDHHYSGCGVCPHCRVGWSQLCRAGITVYGVTAHGGHADYLKVPARTLVPLPEELSFAEGAAVAWMIRAFLERIVNPFWWVTLIAGIVMTGVAFWTAGQFFTDKAYMLLVVAGIWALMQGIDDLVRAFAVRRVHAEL